jgi:hypothetical protein
MYSSNLLLPSNFHPPVLAILVLPTNLHHGASKDSSSQSSIEYPGGLVNDPRTRIGSLEFHSPENPMSLPTSLPNVDST